MNETAAIFPCKVCGRLLEESAFRVGKFPGGHAARRASCRACENAVKSARRSAKSKKNSQGQRVLVIPDCHHPFVDYKAWGVMLRAAASWKPDIVLVLGDFCDFYAVSFHDKDPKRIQNLKWELEQVNAAMDQLDAIGANEKIFLAGNHEFRFDRFLAASAPQLADLPGLSVPEMLRLEERGWKFVPYRKSHQLGKVHFTHDVGQAGQNAARQAGSKYRGNAVIGHTHRMEYSVTGSVDGGPALGAMFGWLGKFEDVDYMHEASARAAWSHGFGIGLLEPSGVLHMSPVPIIEGKAFVAGKLVS